MNDSDLLPIGKLPVGAIYYLDQYPGNVYRKIDTFKAEFIINKNWPQCNGKQIVIGQAQLVRRRPLGYNPNDLLGEDKPKKRRKKEPNYDSLLD